MLRKLLSCLLLAILLVPGVVFANPASLEDIEKIDSFFARIAILPEGGVEVTETIVVVSHGEQVTWGIERFLPRWHSTGDELAYASHVQILEVLRNGTPEEYTLQDSQQGLHLLVGDTTATLDPGRYMYTISYRCSRVVGFYPEQEGLAWNVTGYWNLPIERVSVNLEFSRAPRPRFAAWNAAIGAPGRNDGEWASYVDEESWLHFKSEAPLAPGEAMTIQASWPKGYSFPYYSQDRILVFDSKVKMDSKRNLTVVEEIVLYNNGKYDQGFNRDFPQLYSDGANRRLSQLQVEEVLLDGNSIPWRMEKLPRGERLVISGAVPREISTLSLVYTLDRQVVMGSELEDLRWLLPGYKINEVIDQAVLAVDLPVEIPRDNVMRAAFTRSAEETSGSTFHYLDGNRIIFATTRHLEPGESLVSAVAWPQGYLEPLSWQQKLIWLFRDNASGVATAAILLLLLSWYSFAWHKVGYRGIGEIGPVNSPPQDYSPACLRYLFRRGYDNRTFTAGIISLAVKGCLMIVEEGGKHALVSTGLRPGNLPPDEAALADSLFSERMAIFPAKHKDLVVRARGVQRQQIIEQVRGKLLKSNRLWIYPAAVMALVGAGLSGLLLPVPTLSTVALAGFVLWCSLVVWVVVRTWDLFPGLVDDRGAGIVVLVLGAELLVIGGVTILWSRWLAGDFGWLAVATILGIPAVIGISARLIPGPTSAGRELLKQFKGFRIWLTDYKEGRPGPSRFEKLLPYAVALDVASSWGKRFGVPKRKGSLSPRWYMGSRWHTINAETLTAALSTLPKIKKG